jgi:hypothetical protein
MITLIRHKHVGFAEANREALLALEKPTVVTMMIGVLALTFVFCVLHELVHANRKASLLGNVLRTASAAARSGRYPPGFITFRRKENQ